VTEGGKWRRRPAIANMDEQHTLFLSSLFLSFLFLFFFSFLSLSFSLLISLLPSCTIVVYLTLPFSFFQFLLTPYSPFLSPLFTTSYLLYLTPGAKPKALETKCLRCMYWGMSQKFVWILACPHAQVVAHTIRNIGKAQHFVNNEFGPNHGWAIII